MLARDAAPSRAFERFATGLRSEAFEVVDILGGGKPISVADDAILNEVDHAGLVLIGMSSNAELAREELLAAAAANATGIPWGAYGDVPGCFARTAFWPAGLADNARFYLGFDEQDASLAKEKFPGATTFATGNPLREDMAFPKFTRAEVRGRLGASDEKLILLGGGKSVLSNMSRLSAVLEHVARISGDLKFMVVLSLHPGDRAPYAVDSVGGKGLGIYDEVMRESPVPLVIMGLAQGDLSTSEMIPGMDVVIAGLTGSTTVEAAFNRIPAICLGGEVELRKLQKETGSRNPEPVAKGVAAFCGATEDLGLKILTCVGGDGNPFRSAQEREFPIPVKGGAVSMAVEALNAVFAGIPAEI